MTFLLGLALRNLTRNLRRTVLSMVAVIAGVWVLITGQAAIGGVREVVVRGEVDAMSGHVLVRPAGYPQTGIIAPVDALIAPTPELVAHLDAHATAWTTRLLFSPRAVHGSDAVRVRAIGFDPGRDEAVFPRDTWNVVGRVPASAADGVLISHGVARMLGVDVGDLLALQARTSAGAINALQVPIAGKFTTGNPALDRFGVFVPMDLAADLVRPEGRVSHVLVRLDRRDDAAAFATAITPLVGPGAEVATWVEQTRDMIELQKVRQAALNLIVVALLVISGLSIANTVLMAAYERIREIGTLRAMGMTRQGVVALFVFEGAMMGLIGAAIGAAIGAGMAAYYARHGIDLSSRIGEGAGNMAMAAMLYFEFSPAWIALAFLFGLAIAVVASIYPALVATKLAPADAVRAD